MSQGDEIARLAHNSDAAPDTAALNIASGVSRQVASGNVGCRLNGAGEHHAVGRLRDGDFLVPWNDDFKRMRDILDPPVLRQMREEAARMRDLVDPPVLRSGL